MEAFQFRQFDQKDFFMAERTRIPIQESSAVESLESNLVYKKLAAEGCENYFTYIQWLGLASDPSLVVLPSYHHFFYEPEDLKEVKTIVNQKELNYVKNIKDFLYSIYINLAKNSYFIGAFIQRKSDIRFIFYSDTNSDPLSGYLNKQMNGFNSIKSFFNISDNFIDSKLNRYLTGKTVRSLLEYSSLKLVDMTETKELTFFCAQKNAS